MNFTKFILQSLRHHAGSHIGSFLGMTVGAGVLIGALIVGESVRESLKEMGLKRLGKTHYALNAGDHLFREALAEDLSETVQGNAAGVEPIFAPVLTLPGLASTPDGSARANQVQILGVDARFWELAEESFAASSLTEDNVFLNERLSRQLNLQVGDTLILRVSKPSDLSPDAPLAPAEDLSATLRLTVGGVAKDSQLGRFSLHANQIPPFNAFVSLSALQDRVEASGQANLLLAGFAAEGVSLRKEIDEGLQEAYRIEDLQLKLTELPGQAGFELRSERVFLDEALSQSVIGGLPSARPILTYFVNSLDAGEKAAPYSMVSAAGPELLPTPLSPDEILISQWLQDDLNLKEGDALDLSYYSVGLGRELIERTNRFTVKGVYPMDGALADPSLMPDFPGLTDADNCRDWDTGFPIDTDRIRDKDEDYWDEYRGAPKAVVSLEAGKKMWENRFGELTAIRFLSAAEDEPWTAETLRAAVRSQVAPGMAGLAFEPVRERALAASSQSMDFGGLFIGFSLFLIVAALLLISLLFQLGVERRGTEVGMLLAVGFTPKRVRRVFLGEALGLSLLGAVAGCVMGVWYAKGMLYGLATIWNDAVGSASLSYYGSVATLAMGAMGSVVMAMGTLWWSLRKQFQTPARELLAGATDASMAVDVSKNRMTRMGAKYGAPSALIAVAMALVSWGALGGRENSSGAFFGAGALMLTGGILFSRAWLRGLWAGGGASSQPRSAASMSLIRVAMTNASRRIKRSVSTLGLLACGSFLIASIGVFRLDAVKNADQRSSGTGGFAFWGESSQAVNYDLNKPAGMEFFGLDPEEMSGVSFVSFRVKPGDDASCLNLNRAQEPRLLGVNPRSLGEREAFSFAKVLDGLPREDPWLLLDHSFDDGAIPAIGDMNSILWALGKKVGDTLTYTGEDGKEFKVRLVAGAANSILQGNLIISEQAFTQKYPNLDGYQTFLVDAPAARAEEVQKTLTRALRDFGLELTSTVERMNAFNAVQNTYLSTFQVLGGLGLILGSAGLGVVVARNILERRSELALMRAVGFTRSRLKKLAAIEHFMLLFAGLVIGVGSALVAVIPSLLSPTASPPAQSLGLTLAAVFGLGMIWTWLATGLAMRQDLLGALRNE